MKEAIDLLGGGAFTTTTGEEDAIEVRLQLAVEKVSQRSVEQCVVEALAYFRLRRNHVIHLRTQPTPRFKGLIKHKGPKLNEYFHRRQSLDFAQLPNSELSESEAIDFIKLLRVCVQKLDEPVAGSLDPLSIIEDLDRQLVEAQPHLSGEQGYERRAQKLKDIAFREYGIKSSKKAISQALWPS